MAEITNEEKKWLRQIFSKAIHVENNGSPFDRRRVTHLINAEESFFDKIESMNKEISELREENEELKVRLFNSKENQNDKKEHQSDTTADQ